VLITFVVYFQAAENNNFSLTDISMLALDKCLVPITYYWYHVLPVYSGTVSIIFFGKFCSKF
jgi:hypothetical protein